MWCPMTISIYNVHACRLGWALVLRDSSDIVDDCDSNFTIMIAE